MFTSYPTVRAALVALFRTTLNEDGDPKVFYGHPGADIPGRYVVVGAVVGTVSREPRTRPLRSSQNMREDYSIAVEVRSLARGKQTQESQQALVEDVLAAEPDVLPAAAAVAAVPGEACSRSMTASANWLVPAVPPRSEVVARPSAMTSRTAFSTRSPSAA